LNKETVYDLIQGHGRTDMYLYYATSVGDFERVIEHWIIEEEWIKAIEVISRQVCGFSDAFTIVIIDLLPQPVQPRTLLSLWSGSYASISKRDS